MTTRRELLIALGAGALAWAGTVRAQAPAKVPRIGLLSPWTASDSAARHQAFRLGLRDRGWIEGKNISIEYRYAEGRDDRLPELAADLVRVKADVIVASTDKAIRSAQKATKTIPIVMMAAVAPVEFGMVKSLARPGGNVTGTSQMTLQLGRRRLELLKDMVPELSRVAVLWNPQNRDLPRPWKELQLAARQLGVQLQLLKARNPNDFDQAFEDATRARAGALLILPDKYFVTNLKRIAELAIKTRLPSIYHVSRFADAGGLMAFGPDRADLYRRTATYVDKILKGAKPGDLPVEQPTKFALVVNMKTAKAIGIAIPHKIIVQATRLIE